MLNPDLTRRESRALLRIAGPVVLAEVGWMSMGLVDTVMVAPLGPAAIAATGMGSSVFTAIAIFGMGLMLGLDTLVSQAYGARRDEECIRWLHHGVALALLMSPLIVLITAVALITLDWWGIHPDIRGLVTPYLRVIAIGGPPLLLYAAFRRYLQGIHVVAPVMAALLSANLVNAAVNWLLVQGHFGFPRLGVTGSAWATTIARTYMAAFLFVAVRRELRRRRATRPHVAVAITLSRLRHLIALGAPAASQVTLEVGIFVLATALAARLDPVSSASHQIAANIASLAFMIPLGLSSAAAVRVGHAVGGGDASRAVHAGWTALAIGVLVMVCIGGSMFLWPAQMLRVFSADERILAIGTGLLAIAAAFQLFDGTQAVATGVLRGIGDTRTPMLVNAVGHWFLGLPIGYVLCFRFGWGVTGLWVGLSIGLVFVAVVLTTAWVVRTRRPIIPAASIVFPPDLL